MEPKTCEQCGHSFLPAYRVTKTYWARRRFCSPECTAKGQIGQGKPRGPRRSVEDRFWEKVAKAGPDECWGWTGACQPNGYGFMFRSKRPRTWYFAHRLSYELNVGPIPKGMVVCHHCDNPPCVNPRHLYAGTIQDNVQDRVERDRNADRKGTKNGHNVLTENEVREIMRLVTEDGMSQTAVARMFAVQQQQVSRIVRKVAWSHLWEAS